MELTIQPYGKVLAVDDGANLPAILCKDNAPVSYSCTAGPCGICRCKVLKGALQDTGQEAELTNAGAGAGHLA